MARRGGFPSGRLPAAPLISISHQNAWVEARHGVAFLGPLIASVLRQAGALQKTRVEASCK